MENIKTLYYERFIQHIVESYSAKLKAAKPGHCMKITGLAIKELRILLPLLRPINLGMDVYILSEEEKGDEFIHATKLIELRNNPERAVLILVPSNSRTSAEDSYGDATFQNLSVADLQDSFIWKLISEMPEEKEYLWKQIRELVEELSPSRTTITNYLLYLDLNQYKDEAWGNGLYLFGMLPDKDLVKDDSLIRRRFMINLEKISAVLSDFSMPAADRIAELPLQKNSIQRELMVFLSSESEIDDNIALFESVAEKHPEFNYASMPWVLPGDGGPVKVVVDLDLGKDPKKELVRDPATGDFILSIASEKKGKVKFTITTDPSPKDNPDICSFEIALVNIDDFSEVGVLKKAKVGTNKRASRKLSYNIPNGMFDDGEYMLRVRALDANGIVLDMKKEFKEARVQAAWQEVSTQNPSLQMEQYRLDNHVAYCNESDVFTIDNSGEDIETGDVDKRSKVNSITQAIIHYRSMHLAKEEDLEISEGGIDRNAWVEGALNSTYQFDFGPAYAYQIQLSKKLIQLERTFLNNEEQFGQVEAFLSGNPTDATLLDPTDTARREPKFVAATNLKIPDGLSSLRSELFDLIKDSVDNACGLSCTLDFSQNMGVVKNYLSEYEQWLRDIQNANLSEDQIICIQNLDTVKLTVEMPDGSKTDVKLIAPLHPLRLAWMVNLYELYEDWEEKTLENPKYRKAWFRKLDKLFQGKIPMDIAPLVLSENSMQEAYQYIGELTFGWGTYAQPTFGQDEAFASGYRQLKSYTAMLLNVAREKRIDSDVSLGLVVRHIRNYALSHPYTDKLIINLFNAGDAAILQKHWLKLRKTGWEKT